MSSQPSTPLLRRLRRGTDPELLAQDLNALLERARIKRKLLPRGALAILYNPHSPEESLRFAVRQAPKLNNPQEVLPLIEARHPEWVYQELVHCGHPYLLLYPPISALGTPKARYQTALQHPRHYRKGVDPELDRLLMEDPQRLLKSPLAPAWRKELWAMAQNGKDRSFYQALLESKIFDEGRLRRLGLRAELLEAVAGVGRPLSLLAPAARSLSGPALEALLGRIARLPLGPRADLLGVVLERSDLDPTTRERAQEALENLRRALSEAAREHPGSIEVAFPPSFPPSNLFAVLPHTPERAQALLLLSRHAKRPDLPRWVRDLLYDLKSSVLGEWVRQGAARPLGYLKRAEPNPFDEREDSIRVLADNLYDSLAEENPDSPGKWFPASRAAAWALRAAGEEEISQQGLERALLRLGEQWGVGGLGRLSQVAQPEDLAPLHYCLGGLSWEEIIERPHLLARFHPYHLDLAVYAVDSLQTALHGPRVQAPHPQALPALPGEAGRFGRPPTPAEQAEWPLERVVASLAAHPEAILQALERSYGVYLPPEESYEEEEDELGYLEEDLEEGPA